MFRESHFIFRPIYIVFLQARTKFIERDEISIVKPLVARMRFCCVGVSSKRARDAAREQLPLVAALPASLLPPGLEVRIEAGVCRHGGKVQQCRGQVRIGKCLFIFRCSIWFCRFSCNMFLTLTLNKLINCISFYWKANKRFIYLSIHLSIYSKGSAWLELFKILSG